MTICTDQDVLRLKISVHHIEGVDILDGKKDLSDEESCLILFENLLNAQVIRKVASRTQVKDHVEVLRRLESIVHFKDERVGRSLQDVGFADCILEVIVFYEECFVKNFHSHGIALGV